MLHVYKIANDLLLENVILHVPSYGGLFHAINTSQHYITSARLLLYKFVCFLWPLAGNVSTYNTSVSSKSNEVME